jgi:hypothetical protein
MTTQTLILVSLVSFGVGMFVMAEFITKKRVE